MELKILNISLLQSNPIVGDFAYNISLIVEAAEKARLAKADVLITPELSITGYPPEDLLLRNSFIESSDSAIKKLVENLAHYRDLYILIGHPKSTSQGLQNCVSIILNGNIVFTYAKQILPNKEVFDEARYFIPGDCSKVFNIKDTPVSILICEDIWSEGPISKAKELGAKLILSINASPFQINKEITRQKILRKRVRAFNLPIIYLNAVGGQDELVFDGGSFAIGKSEKLAIFLPQFKSVQAMIQFDNVDFIDSEIKSFLSEEAQIYEALVLGVKDYIKKNNFPGVIIGLSGGVDSALVLAIAVDALGQDKVRAVMMPSVFTSDISLFDADILAKNFKVQYDILPINDSMNIIEASLINELKKFPRGIAEENIQARIRGLFLMSISNKTGSLVLTTGNKSEMAVGYCTMYGDMAGGFAVIKDITKTLVYRLCRYRNKSKIIIPERVIERAPSAELRLDQKDQDSLPPYEILDQVLMRFMEQNQSVANIITDGFKEDDVNKITNLIIKNEYKRRQSPIGIKISSRAFGRDWRYPITVRFN